jgi:16S rRNA G1207 methylase RsmC
MLNIQRYPKTNNKSLVAWNSADEYLLSYFLKQDYQTPNILLQGDRFGFIACNLHSFKPTSVIAYKSQEKALLINLEENNLAVSDISVINPLDSISKVVDIALVKIPKSLDLFKLYLYQISRSTNKDTIVFASFMTKYFSKQILKIASEFYEEVEQSLAWKKSRILILKRPKPYREQSLISSIKLSDDFELKQYFGVFSAKNIDYATSFLLENVSLNKSDRRILDLASGNGIIAYSILQRYANSNWEKPEMHLIDDSYLAVESSKINISKSGSYHHYNDNMEMFEDKYFDLIVTNPPFHFEYEINTEISVGFFKQAHRCLNTGGRFQLVFNRHLNYKPLLRRVFKNVELIAENSKFVVLQCHSDN